MTSFRFTTSFVFITLLGFVLLVGGLAPYYLFYIFILSLLIPFLHSYIALRNIQGIVKIPDGALYTGDKIEIKYRVENKSRLSIPYLEVRSSITRLLTGKNSKASVASLRPKMGFTNKEIILLGRRGFYKLGKINVTIHDVFGFYSLQKTLKSNTSLLVYPEIIQLNSLKINAHFKSGELLTEGSLFQDRNHISSLRDYHEGDSIKAIHWKLTAKKDKIVVKNYEHRVESNAVIFLDNEYSWFAEDVDRRLEDKSVDIALSIIHYCLNHDIEVILNTQSESRYIHIEGNEKADLKPYLEELTRLRANGASKIESLITPQIDVINKGTTIIIISPRLDKSLGSISIDLRAKNLDPVIIAISDRENKTRYIDSNIENRLYEEGIPIYIIDYGSNIKDVLEVYHG